MRLKGDGLGTEVSIDKLNQNSIDSEEYNLSLPKQMSIDSVGGAGYLQGLRNNSPGNVQILNKNKEDALPNIFRQMLQDGSSVAQGYRPIPVTERNRMRTLQSNNGELTSKFQDD